MLTPTRPCSPPVRARILAGGSFFPPGSAAVGAIFRARGAGGVRHHPDAPYRPAVAPETQRKGPGFRRACDEAMLHVMAAEDAEKVSDALLHPSLRQQCCHGCWYRCEPYSDSFSNGH